VPGRCVAGGACQANDFCNFCDGQANNFFCSCRQGVWACMMTDGPCGVACGGAHCLTTEICVGSSLASGVPGSPPPQPVYSCHPLPPACQTAAPVSCACAARTLCIPNGSCGCQDVSRGTIWCQCAAP
jgi:hypothetical protein